MSSNKAFVWAHHRIAEGLYIHLATDSSRECAHGRDNLQVADTPGIIGRGVSVYVVIVKVACAAILLTRLNRHN